MAKELFIATKPDKICSAILLIKIEILKTLCTTKLINYEEIAKHIHQTELLKFV